MVAEPQELERFDGNAAMTACNSASDYASVCAGKRAGDPSQRATWALPHHDSPGGPPDSAGVANALARFSQTQGLINASAAKAHLQRHASELGIGDANKSDIPVRPFERILPLDHIAIRSDGVGRTVEAYAAVFDRATEVGGYYFVSNDPAQDSYGQHEEIIDRSAFDKTIAHHGTEFQVLFNHGKTIQGVPAERYSMPLGTPIEIRPDSKGLLTVTRYADTPLANEVLELIHNDSIRSQSFGGRVISAAMETTRSEDSMDLVRVSEIALREYGPCVFPAYKDAAIVAVRSNFLADELGSLPEDERNTLLERMRLQILGAIPEPEPVDSFQAELSRWAKEKPQELARAIQGAITVSDEPAATAAEQESDEMVDPNKTLKDLEERQGLIKDREREIDAESGMAPLNETQRTEWNALEAEYKENDIAIRDKRRRIRDIGRVAEGPEDNDRSEDGWESPSDFNVVVQRTNEDIYDLSTIRGAFSEPEFARQQLRDRALRAVERGNFPQIGRRANKEDMQSHVEYLLNTADNEDAELAQRILKTGHPLYEAAFWKKLVGKNLSGPETKVMERALGVATTGYAMPFTLDPTVALTSSGVVNPLRDISRVITITGQTWDGVNSAGITASFVAESTVGTDNSPTLTQKTTTVLKAQAFVPYSIESEAWDGIRAELTLEFQDAKDQLEADKFTLGTGSPLPQGLTIGATSLATTAATATLALSDIDAMTDALPPRYQANATMVMNRKIASKIRQLARTAGATPEWAPEGGSAPGNLLGYPRRELSSLVGTTTSGSLMCYVGDFSKFLIVDRVGMSVEYVPMLFDPTASVPLPLGQRGLYCYWMTTSLVRDPNAFRGLKIL